jgi:hypothetical protein
MDKGVRGYGWLAMNATNPTPGAPGMPDRWAGIAGAMTVFDERPEAVQDILGPLNDTVQERFYGTAVVLALEVQSYDSWLEYYDVHFDNGTTGGGAHMVSRLLDEESLTSDPEALKKALTAATGASEREMIDFYLLGGKGVHNAKPRGGSNSVNPGWRKAYIHTREFEIVCFLVNARHPADATNNSDGAQLHAIRQGRRGKGEEAARQSVRAPPGANARTRGVPQRGKSTPRIKRKIPGLTKVEQAATFEKDPAGTFWGDNYKRLLRIKRSVDPHDTFWCSPCVGNERWEEKQDGRLCQRKGKGFEIDIEIDV